MHAWSTVNFRCLARCLSKTDGARAAAPAAKGPLGPRGGDSGVGPLPPSLLSLSPPVGSGSAVALGAVDGGVGWCGRLEQKIRVEDSP